MRSQSRLFFSLSHGFAWGLDSSYHLSKYTFRVLDQIRSTYLFEDSTWFVGLPKSSSLLTTFLETRHDLWACYVFFIIDLKYSFKKSVTNGTWCMHNLLLFGNTEYKLKKNGKVFLRPYWHLFRKKVWIYKHYKINLLKM